MSPGQGYAFGPYRFDPIDGRLTRDGEAVRVPLNALALLTVLLSRAGYLVTNEELMADAWPNTEANEDHLAIAMSALRAALLDERGDQYIETVPRTGYRFIAPVTATRIDAVWLEGGGDAASGGSRLSLAWAAAGVVVLLGAIGAALYFGSGAPSGPAPGSVSSLVVIPFQTGASGDQGYLGLGMADALSMRLSAVDQLRVPPTAAVQPREDAFDAGRRLAVDAVLTGSIQRDGDRVRVMAQLSQVGDRRQMWTARFDDSFTDIFAVQDAIAERIVNSLLRDVKSGQRAVLHRRETENVEAYDRYLRGREQWSRRTIDATQAAIQLYQEAIALDPSYAGAYAGLADAYVGNASGLPPAERFPLARAAVDHALELNPDLADAQVALGYLLYRADWDLPDAERALNKAIAIDPKNNLAHHHLGQVHKLGGRFEESLANFRKAHELDPHHPRTHVDIAIVLLFLGRVDEARAIVEDGMKHVEDNAELHEELADVIEAEGHADESMTERLKAREMGGVPVEEIEALREAYRTGGHAGELRKENEIVTARFADNKGTAARGPASTLCENYAHLHDRDRAIHWMEQAINRREEGPLGIRFPTYDFLRSDPRFVALERRVFGEDGVKPAPNVSSRSSAQ
jgi:DNA-binding winged helix-turn-helix (wHTH) protein/TolB-like protein/Tfp pilus assembly protein PilF